MCQEKKEAGDLSVLKMSWIHQNQDIKKSQEKLITAVSNSSDKQSNNNKETEMGRKTTVRIFQTINWQNFTQKDLEMTTGGGP